VFQWYLAISNGP